ncbi:hypothetical protein BD779DRAFT_333709 [Infundibulicybe gibba]|nr:hypothetical protein BD779DRAFT_333709 [Infundibulicybe gibba]
MGSHRKESITSLIASCLWAVLRALPRLLLCVPDLHQEFLRASCVLPDPAQTSSSSSPVTRPLSELPGGTNPCVYQSQATAHT